MNDLMASGFLSNLPKVEHAIRISSPGIIDSGAHELYAAQVPNQFTSTVLVLSGIMVV
jgi:hypothetical protein